MPSLTAPRLAAALGDELTESEATLRVFLTAGGLAVLGLALLLFTIWWWRGTKPESPALGPLEVMSERRWHAASDSERRRLVDTHRPAGALDLPAAPQPIDLSVLAREMPSTFDDLREDASSSEVSEVDAPSSDGDGEPVEVALFELEPLPADPEGEPEQEVEVSPVDPTKFELERPAAGSANGVRHRAYEQLTIGETADDHEPAEPDEDGSDDEVPQMGRSARADEYAIDPLLQRTTSQD
ncbi:MAG: hypothetical protein AB7L17_17330 [Ilumatobacteraceae bacterium]